MELRRFTRLVYLHRFFSEFNPIYPLYALMFVEYGNLSTTEVSLLFFIWFLVAFLAEIPTGVIADKMSRRNSSLIGRLLLIGTFVSWLFFPTFWGFAFGFFLWGLGFAFSSGATDAYIFDTYKQCGGEESTFTKLYSKTASLKMLGMFFAFLVSIFLIPYGYEVVLITSVVVSAIVPIILLIMPEDDMEHMSHRSQISILGEALQILSRKKILIMLASFLMFLGGSIGVLDEYMPLYYSWNGFATQEVVILLTVGMLIASAIELTAHLFDQESQGRLFLLVSCAGFILFGTSFFVGWIASIGFYIFLRILILMQTSLTARMHTMIDSGARATIFSLITFIAEIVAVVGAGLIALIQIYRTDIDAVAWLGLGIGVTSLLFILLNDKTTIPKN